MPFVILGHSPVESSKIELRVPMSQHVDAPIAVTGHQRTRLTEEDHVRIKRKTDMAILPVLVWIYFLQVLDKAVLGTGSLFNLREDTGMHGNQYSWIGSISPIAQLAWQPFSTWLIVKVPHRILMPTLTLGWGISQACMAGCRDFVSLLVARFFLGLFEGGCLPLFSVITSQWYRRAEQPIRVAIWYSTNGAATITASVLAYVLGHIPSAVMKPWQITFLFTGLVTIASSPWAYWRLDNNISSARFLTERERQQAAERLHFNQTSAVSREFKWSQVWEAVLEPKSYLWIAMSVLVNIGASVAVVFGPLVVSSFGFDKFRTSLLNIPFGAIQALVILASCWAAQKAKLKCVALASFMIPVIVGVVILYVLERRPSDRVPLLVSYYLLACLFSGNPLIVSWIIGNTAGTTKQSVNMALYQAGSSVGNIVGPLLFNEKDAPVYHRGLRAVLGVFVALIMSIGIQVINLMVLNKLQSQTRVNRGKQATIDEQSMANKYHSAGSGKDVHGGLGQQASLDLTDRQNDEFVYIY
ncbi:MFS transporter [Histoplasma capsulatum var. duboisii H88]|uniref:MFS transporter n=2 Tax=Ajellomyces capsulatus TaxID=5037 RepID=F0U510_AJEC8|nr:MFS transporter [Histoplasma capsulatum var. duboisii H88]